MGYVYTLASTTGSASLHRHRASALEAARLESSNVGSLTVSLNIYLVHVKTEKLPSWSRQPASEALCTSFAHTFLAKVQSP